MSIFTYLSLLIIWGKWKGCNSSHYRRLGTGHAQTSFAETTPQNNVIFFFTCHPASGKYDINASLFLPSGVECSHHLHCLAMMRELLNIRGNISHSQVMAVYLVVAQCKRHLVFIVGWCVLGTQENHVPKLDTLLKYPNWEGQFYTRRWPVSLSPSLTTISCRPVRHLCGDPQAK